MSIYRKIGGIHWLAIGNVRISICRKHGAANTGKRDFANCIAVAAIGAAIGLATVQAPEPKPNPVPTYRLTMEANDGNLYVMDHGLTLSDCIGAMHGMRRAGCEIERK
jgi:hypothetical protein